MEDQQWIAEMLGINIPATSSLPTVGKVLIYILDPGLEKYLTFTQPDSPDAGRQIPAGTIEGGETPLQAALRELGEETGWGQNMDLLHFADTVHDMSAHKPEIHLRSWFLGIAKAKDFPPGPWTHRESRAGQPDIVADFLWLDISSGEHLIAGHSELLPAALHMAGR